LNVSVLIIVHDRPNHLRACLHALALQARPADQIVVVDDGSPPESATAIRSIIDASTLPIELVTRARDTYCPAAARNEAVRHAQHDYLLFYDCDILAFPDAIEKHLAAAAVGTFMIGNCGYLPAEPSQRFFDSTAWDASTLIHAWSQADLRLLHRAARSYRRNALLRRIGCARRHKPRLKGCQFSLYREDFLRVNGFDEAFTEWGYEDDDLGMRLYMSGLASRSLISTARALHLYHPSAQQPRARHAKPNRDYFYRKHVATRCARGILTA